MTPETLKQLCERATPGPWYAPHIGMDSISVSGNTDVGIAAHSTIISFLPLEQTDSDGRTWTAHGGTIQDNRKLVATSRNALPALVKLWEAVKDYQTWYRNEPITGSDRHAERQASNAIQSALSELEAL